MPSINHWFIYMIRSDDNSLYTGITTDPQRRFIEHQSKSKKSAKYLRVRNVIELEFVEAAADRSAASKREYQIKQLTKSQKEALVMEYKRTKLCFHT